MPKHEAEVPEEAVQAELEALQRTVAELVPVDSRPAAQGDTVVVDLVADDGSAQRDYVVELGSERLVEEIENGVRGLAAGEQREIAYELADGSRRSATVVLKEVKERVLPPLDDELAKSATEFDTLDELRGEIETRLRAQIDEELAGAFRGAAVDELVKASNVQASGPLVELRTRELLAGLARSLQARGIDAGTYLQLTGQTLEQLNERLYAEASLSVARELILEAVADKLGLQVTDDEIRDELRDGRRDRRGDREVRRRRRRRPRARRPPVAARARPGRRRGEADRARTARGTREHLDAGEGAAGRAREAMDPRQLRRR